MTAAEGKKHFFVSYTDVDRRWAKWIAWVLEEAKYSVVLQAWDFHAGENFIANMHRALETTIRTLAVLSPDYFASAHCQQEWTAALAKARQDGADRLLPVRIAEFVPPGLFAPIAYLDLVDIEEREARDILLAGVRRTRAKPENSPLFPGSYARVVVEKPRFPGPLVEKTYWGRITTTMTKPTEVLFIDFKSTSKSAKVVICAHVMASRSRPGHVRFSLFRNGRNLSSTPQPDDYLFSIYIDNWAGTLSQKSYEYIDEAEATENVRYALTFCSDSYGEACLNSDAQGKETGFTRLQVLEKY